MKLKNLKIWNSMMKRNFKSKFFLPLIYRKTFRFKELFSHHHRRFWNMKSENCPEIRCQIAQKSRRNEEKQIEVEKKSSQKPPKLFSDSGRPYCLNFARLNFQLLDESDRYELNLHVYK